MGSTPFKKQTLDSMYSDWSRSQDPAHMEAMLDHLSPDMDKAVYAYSGLNAGPAVKTRAKLLAANATYRKIRQQGGSWQAMVGRLDSLVKQYAEILRDNPANARSEEHTSEL